MDYLNLANAPANPHLSLPTVSPEAFRGWPHCALYNNSMVLRVTPTQARTRLEQVQQDVIEREQKIVFLTHAVENHAAAGPLVNVYNPSDFQINVNKLSAEIAMRDRLLLAIRGMERFIEWRIANPIAER